MRKNKLREEEMRKEDGRCIADPPLRAAVGDGEEVGDDDDDDEDDDDDDDEMVVKRGVADELEPDDVVLPCTDGVVSRMPTVLVDVNDGLRDWVREEGMGRADVAEGSGELNDPDMPVRVKNGE